MRFKPLHNGERFVGLRLHSPSNATERRLIKALEDVLRTGGRIEVTPEGDVAITETFRVRGQPKSKPEPNPASEPTNEDNWTPVEFELTFLEDNDDFA